MRLILYYSNLDLGLSMILISYSLLLDICYSTYILLWSLSARMFCPTRVNQLEKHIWICAFMAVGAKYGVTVGDVEKIYNAEVRSLIDELANVCTMKTNISFPTGVADRLCAYARSVAHFPTALKEQKVKTRQ